MKYSIAFEFDCEGDPPGVFIAQPGGSKVLEVFDEPSCLGEWTVDPDKWKVGTFTERLLRLMNEHA